MRRMYWICFWLLSGFLIHVSAGAQQVGSPAPDFTLETFDGRRVTLSELKGKEVCIMTWASWCPHCKASMPGLNAFYEESLKSSKPFEVLAVAIRDTPEKAKGAYADRAMPYPAGIEDASFEKLYPAARKTPSWIIVDKAGIVREVSSGRATRNEIETMIKRVQ